jgi:hypothetical protein
MKKTSEFQNSLTLPLQPVYDEKRILASRYQVKDPTDDTWIQVHHNYRLFPVATIWRNDPNYGAYYFLVTNDVAAELVPHMEYKRSALLLYRERRDPNYFYLWITNLRDSCGMTYQQQIDKLTTKHWAKVQWNGLREDTGTPEVRIPNPDGIGNRLIKPRVEPETPPPWATPRSSVDATAATLPDLESIIRNAFRGRIIDSMSHPLVSSL